MKKFLMLLVMVLLAIAILGAQETPQKQQPDKDAIVRHPATPTYKLAFSIYELQDGKKINQRDYSLWAEADDRAGNKLKIGTRVPIDIGEGKMTYADVGFDMECSVAETVNNKVAVRLDMTVTNFAIPEQNTDPRTAGNRPVLRGVTERVRAVVTPGKPQIITSMDDVNSTKRMQVELTATKVD